LAIWIEECGLRIWALAGVLALTTGGAEPDLKTVLQRAAQYTEDYHQRFTALVAEERYIQRVGPGSARGVAPRPFEQERTLISDYVIVRDFAGSNSWLGVRDVYEVDGQPVNADRTRLQNLLADRTRPLASRVRALADLQAKYNLGDLYRTINVPTLALEFLLRDRQPRFRFKRRDTATFRGTPAWIVTFEERQRPTIIRTPEGRDVRSTGAFWIDPSTGAVLRSELRAGQIPGRPLQSIIIVSYTHNPRFDMLLPDDMNELYLTGRSRIEGHATYRNFRRFETDVRIR
jgi:hypothetical protein